MLAAVWGGGGSLRLLQVGHVQCLLALGYPSLLLGVARDPRDWWSPLPPAAEAVEAAALALAAAAQPAAALALAAAAEPFAALALAAAALAAAALAILP